MADEGKAVSRHEGLVVFIDKAVPGDIVDVIIKKKHKSYLEAEVVKLVRPSASRIDPFCKHFGICGGCKWQHISYAEQLKFKKKIVADAFERIGKIDFPDMPDVLGCENNFFYRNKL